MPAAGPWPRAAPARWCCRRPTPTPAARPSPAAWSTSLPPTISAAALITLNGGGLQWATGNTADISAQLDSLGSGGATFDTNGNNVTFATALGGTGGLTKAGTGTLTLSGANTYSGATTVNAGTLQLAVGASLPVGGALAINGGTFATNGNVGLALCRAPAARSTWCRAR